MACSAFSLRSRAPSVFFSTGSPRSALISFKPMSRISRSLPVLLITVPSTLSARSKSRADGLVTGIHQQVRSTLNLGDAGNPAGNRVGTCSAGAHNFDRDTVRPDEIGRTDQRAHGLLHGLDLGWPGFQADTMAFIADQAAKAQTLRQPQTCASAKAGFAGEHSTTAHAGVHIDDDIQRHLRAEPDAAESAVMVRSLSTPTMMSVTRESLDKAFDLGRACDLIGQQDAVNTAPGQCFRFAQRGAGDSDRAMGQLPPGKGHAFVVLIMRAQLCRPLGKESSHLA